MLPHHKVNYLNSVCVCGGGVTNPSFGGCLFYFRRDKNGVFSAVDNRFENLSHLHRDD